MKKFFVLAAAVAVLSAGCGNPAGNDNGSNGNGGDTYRAVEKQKVTYVPFWTDDFEQEHRIESRERGFVQKWVDGEELNDIEMSDMFGTVDKNTGRNKPPLEYFKAEYPGVLFVPTLPADTKNPDAFASSANTEIQFSQARYYVEMTAVIFEWVKVE